MSTSTDPQAELQKRIYDLLTDDTRVMALADGVYDAVPPEPFKEIKQGGKNGYISFGSHDVVEDDAECITAGIHTIQIDCWSRQVGSVHCKRMVDAVNAALHLNRDELTVNGLGELRVVLRLTMRDPDGLTTHGVVQVEAQIEELTP